MVLHDLHLSFQAMALLIGQGVVTLQSPLIMAGPPGWSDCGPLATWAGNEWVVLLTLCYIRQHYNLIWQKLRGWIFIARILFIFWRTATTMGNIRFLKCFLHWLVSCMPRDWIFFLTQFLLLFWASIVTENIVLWSFFFCNIIWCCERLAYYGILHYLCICDTLVMLFIDWFIWFMYVPYFLCIIF